MGITLVNQATHPTFILLEVFEIIMSKLTAMTMYLKACMAIGQHMYDIEATFM